MSATAKELDIQQWLLELGVRCVPRGKEDVSVMVRDYAAGLTDLPHTAFTPASREQASRKWKFFPAYADLRKFLESYAPRKSTVAALPPVEDPALSEEDRAHVRSWINLRDEGNRTLRLGMYCEKWPRAFAYIVRTDAEAERIARQREWLRDEADKRWAGPVPDLRMRTAPAREPDVLPTKPSRTVNEDRALLQALRDNFSLPRREERLRALLDKYAGHPGFAWRAGDPRRLKPEEVHNQQRTV